MEDKTRRDEGRAKLRAVERRGALANAKKRRKKTQVLLEKSYVRDGKGRMGGPLFSI